MFKKKEYTSFCVKIDPYSNETFEGIINNYLKQGYRFSAFFQKKHEFTSETGLRAGSYESYVIFENVPVVKYGYDSLDFAGKIKYNWYNLVAKTKLWFKELTEKTNKRKK
jgi:hypothetical protein